MRRFLWLPLVTLVVLALVLAMSGRTSAQTNPASPDAPQGTPTVGASPDELARLQSWGLVLDEFPEGTRLLNQSEVPNYAVAFGDPDVEKEIASLGRVTGYLQSWQQDTDQLQFKVELELYNSPAAAIAQLTNRSSFSGQGAFEDLPDPNLGDQSYLFGYTLTRPDGVRVGGWIVQWVRGRTLLRMSGGGPEGTLSSDLILRDAQIIDSRAAQAPIQ